LQNKLNVFINIKYYLYYFDIAYIVNKSNIF